MIRLLPPIFTLLAIISCTQPSTLSGNEKATIIAEATRTLQNYYADIKKSGLTAEFDYLDHSADFFWVPPGYPAAISYDSVAAVLRQNAPNYLSINNAFDTLKIIPLSKELASYTGRLHSTMIDTAGIATTFSLVETGLLIKRKDGWKLLHGQTALVNQ